MTIDNPDDFCSFKGKDIDFEDEKYDPFPVYRFKPVAMNMLKHCIVPSRLDNLVANLEYIGSRKMANVEELELAESTLSFFTNEFPRYWLKKGSEALLTSVPEILVSMQDPKPVGGESPLSIPFLTESIRGDEGKVAILVAPQCFEKNPVFPAGNFHGKQKTEQSCRKQLGLFRLVSYKGSDLQALIQRQQPPQPQQPHHSAEP